MQFGHLSLDQKLEVLLEEFDKARIRERRNTEFILRVLTTRLDAILAAVNGQQLKGSVQFGKPQAKTEAKPTESKPTAEVSQPVKSQIPPYKEKPRG